MLSRVENIVKSAFIETMPGNEYTNAAIFLGHESVMESVDLVSFILLVEEKVNDEFQASISLMDEKAFSAKNSPFKNAESLTSYILERLKDV